MKGDDFGVGGLLGQPAAMAAVWLPQDIYEADQSHYRTDNPLLEADRVSGKV